MSANLSAFYSIFNIFALLLNSSETLTNWVNNSQIRHDLPLECERVSVRRRWDVPHPNWMTKKQ